MYTIVERGEERVCVSRRSCDGDGGGESTRDGFSNMSDRLRHLSSLMVFFFSLLL